MYEELVTKLRNCAELNSLSYYKRELMAQAADTIEKLNVFNLMWQEAAKIANEAEPKWIPVTERLPVKDENVLLCYQWTGISGTVYTEVDIASFEEIANFPTKQFKPLYWMPLPEPPKEVDDGTA